MILIRYLLKEYIKIKGAQVKKIINSYVCFIVVVFTMNMRCCAEVMLSHNSGYAISLSDGLMLDFVLHDYNGSRVDIARNVSNQVLEKFFQYIFALQQIMKEGNVSFTRVEKLSKLALSSNDTEWAQLFNMATFFQIKDLGWGLAREYLCKNITILDRNALLNPGQELMPACLEILKKQYFLLTKDKTLDVKLTLEELMCGEDIFVGNSKLDLSGRHLISLDGIEIFPAFAVDRLDISNNDLEALPGSIGKFVKVRNLNLSHNKLKRLPNSFGNLTILERLDLNDNNLATLPDSLGLCVSLWRLDVSNNKLTQTPSFIEKLKNLHMFKSKGNLFTEPSQTSVAG